MTTQDLLERLDHLDDRTQRSLRKEATKLQIPGRSSMTTALLRGAIRAALEAELAAAGEETEAPAPGEALEETEAPAPGEALEETEAPSPGEALEETEAPAPGEALEETEGPSPVEALEETEAPASGEAPDDLEEAEADLEQEIEPHSLHSREPQPLDRTRPRRRGLFDLKRLAVRGGRVQIVDPAAERAQIEAARKRLEEDGTS